MVTKEIRNEVFDTASDVVQFLYSSGVSGAKQKDIAHKFLLDTPDVYKKFALTVGDLILGFYKIEDTIPLLQQELEIDQATAEKLGAEVLVFLAPLSDPTWQPPTDEDDENTDNSDLTTNEVSVAIPSTPQASTQIHEPDHYEPIIIPEIRTMAADMAIERSPARSTFNAATEIDEPVHISSQPTLEKKVVDVPTYSIPQHSSPKTDADSRWN